MTNQQALLNKRKKNLIMLNPLEGRRPNAGPSLHLLLTNGLVSLCLPRSHLLHLPSRRDNNHSDAARHQSENFLHHQQTPAPKRCHLKWQLDGWGLNHRQNKTTNNRRNRRHSTPESYLHCRNHPTNHHSHPTTYRRSNRPERAYPGALVSRVFSASTKRQGTYTSSTIRVTSHPFAPTKGKTT